MKITTALLSICFLFVIAAQCQTQLSKIAFLRGEFIYLKDQKTGAIRRLTKGYYPSLSPDGETLAYEFDTDAVGRDMVRRIQLMDLATGKIRIFESLNGRLSIQPRWSPDGTRIAFHVFDKDWHVAVIDPVSGKWSNISITAKPKGELFLTSWTADSKTVFAQDLDNIYQIDLEGSLVRKLKMSDIVDDPGYITSSSVFSLSSSGKILLFDTDEEPDDPRPPSVWTYDLDKNMRTKLTAKNFAAYNPQWISSEEIIFTGSQWRGNKRISDGIYRMKIGGAPVLIIPNASECTFALEK